MKIKIQDIHDIATSRPDGYVDDVMSNGYVDKDNEFLEISLENYKKLLKKYEQTVTVIVSTDKESNSKTPDLKALDSIAPNSTDMVKSFIGSAVKWGREGFKSVSSDVLDTRLSICKGCEFWDRTGFVNTGRCKKCGCSTQAKLRMATEKCPIGKW